MDLERTRIELVDTGKTYADGTRGLEPTTLAVEPGEVMALLGPSGCGKTTLLRLVAGLETADAGSRILFGGQDVTARPVEKRGVGMVFQSYALFPQMTVAANIGYGLTVRGVAEAERKRTVGELVDLVRLNGLEHRKPAELSGGQRQRVALARAVAVKPRVLLLDEPLAALDAKLKEQLRDELAEMLRRLGITALHVTHDQQEAFAVADRLAVMHAGRVVQVGTAETLYRAPAHGFVASFLGRVNRIQRQGRTVLVRPEDVEVSAPREGWLAATVVQRTFLGDRVHLRLDAAGEALLADAPRDATFRAGQTVGVRIATEHLLDVPETAS